MSETPDEQPAETQFRELSANDTKFLLYRALINGGMSYSDAEDVTEAVDKHVRAVVSETLKQRGGVAAVWDEGWSAAESALGVQHPGERFNPHEETPK